MDASAALAEALMVPPIISEIDTAGLALLSQVLMDEPADSADAIISMPLPEPLPPEKDTLNVAKPIGSEEKEHITVVTAETTEPLAFEPISGLLPPATLEDVGDLAAKDEFAVEESLGDEKMAKNPLSTLPAAQGGDIAAYFALEFLDLQYIYYLQRSSVSLGRSSNDSSGTAADIDLGPLKNISRLHARIEYEEELERFVLAVVGRNGAFVDGNWYGPGKRIPLGNGTLIQISTRTFHFLLPHSNTPSASGDGNVENDMDNEVPALDSAVTTVDDDSHSTNASATPKQGVVIPEHEPDEEDDLALDEENAALDQMEFYRSLSGKGKGKGKGKAPTAPPKRGRGRPRKSSTATKVKPAPASSYTYDDEEEVDLRAADMDDFESEIDDEDDRDGDFVPKRTKSGGRRRGGLGKVKSGTTARAVRTSVDAVEVKDEEMSDAEIDQLDEADELQENDAGTEALSPTAEKKSAPKRKRELVDLDFEDVPLGKRRRTASSSAPTEANKAPKQPKGRKKGSSKPEMKSLFTTTPAPLPSASAAANAENGEADLGDKAKGGKKGKAIAKKGKKTTGDGTEDQDELKEDESESKEVKEEPKPTGPPPPKPPFTYPLLCYRALKALNGKAPYRAITKWLETEYPYFAAATRDGKDGWENSTRHTLSSHRAFIKIDRKPEERGKGCFWSFDPEFEEQFKDQWRASESQARNPRPGPRPPNPPPPFQGAPGIYPRPPFPGPPPMGWQGVTPPHLMPGYRPMPPGAPGPAYPYPSMPRPPGMMPHPLGPHPPPMRPMMGPPPLGGPIPPGASAAAAKARAPKKSKAALGAAFSRAPLIRPGLGGVPSKPGESSTGDGGVDELVLRGEHIIRMATRAAKDELLGRAPPGMGIAVATGGWGVGGFPPPIPVHGAKGPGKHPISNARPTASQKIKFVLSEPPPEAPVPMAPPVPMNQAKPDASDGGEKEKPVPRPLVVPLLFFSGTLYINPKAYSQLDEEDVTKMNGMTFADAMAHVMAKCAPIPAPSRPPAPNTKVSGDKDEEKEEDEDEASQSPIVDSPADDGEGFLRQLPT